VKGNGKPPRGEKTASSPKLKPCALVVRNRQRKRKVDTNLLNQVAQALIEEVHLETFSELGIYVVAATEMTRLNETFLQHHGSTDVIAFDYSGDGHPTASSEPIARTGEVFICLDEAQVQARRFRVPWQTELVRYMVHGVLHLCGHLDHIPAKRRRMKVQENRVLRLLAARFDLLRLA
jgi:probable rRNA maturation factor